MQDRVIFAIAIAYPRHIRLWRHILASDRYAPHVDFTASSKTHSLPDNNQQCTGTCERMQSKKSDLECGKPFVTIFQYFFQYFSEVNTSGGRRLSRVLQPLGEVLGALGQARLLRERLAAELRKSSRCSLLRTTSCVSPIP